MEAGRELDRLIAEKIFGLDKEHQWPQEDSGADDHVIYKCENCGRLWDECCEKKPKGSCSSDCPEYSTDLLSAWLIIDHLRERRPNSVTFNIHMPPTGGYDLYIYEHGVDTYGRWRDRFIETIRADTCPLGICIAALAYHSFSLK